ncbi:DUF938 domain-containing protein [Vibrio sp. S11_S32]|uniref:DUF938 domain-containing protein n=1 Tax=Vibrio sp. S11_S32 TaxID=2720225 RepID=UPI0016804834|nr:DUF938 domain-containing protein [Vibrio sp. S11_S32]MBD1574979.1 DUF938 domain-containing protein [Vibrio sp. S11_S32]
MTKRTSPYCEKNQKPILEHLFQHFKDVKHVLEIGSGTGQHAVFFAKQLPHLIWHTSDMTENHANIDAWLGESELDNVVSPVAFTLGQDPFPNVAVDAVFTANTTHIMQPQEAQQMMELVAANLPAGGVFCQYGPMTVNGEFTTDSNREFDANLKSRGLGGIRDIEQLKQWASGMELIHMHPMPANNFLLVWGK